MLEEDSPASVAIATDLAIPVIAEHGMSAVTPQSIADRAGCSRQAVHQWFRGEPISRVVAARFAARWRRWAAVRVGCEGVAGLLPENEEVATWTRVWLGLVELGGRDSEIASIIGAMRDCEVDLVRSALTRRGEGPGGPAAAPPEHEVLALHCLMEGLRLRLLTPVAASPASGAMTFDIARRILDGAVGTSGGSGRHLA